MRIYVVMETDGWGVTSMVMAFYSMERAKEFAEKYGSCWIEEVDLEQEKK